MPGSLRRHGQLQWLEAANASSRARRDALQNYTGTAEEITSATADVTREFDYSRQRFYSCDLQ